MLENYIISRTDYDDLCRERFQERWPDDPERVREEMIRRYPAGAADAAREFEERGLLIEAEEIPRLAAEHGIALRRVGRAHLLYLADIEDLIEKCLCEQRMTHEALWRKAQDISASDELAIRREVLAKRRREAQEAGQ